MSKPKPTSQPLTEGVIIRNPPQPVKTTKGIVITNAPKPIVQTPKPAPPTQGSGKK